MKQDMYLDCVRLRGSYRHCCTTSVFT